MNHEKLPPKTREEALNRLSQGESFVVEIEGPIDHGFINQALGVTLENGHRLQVTSSPGQITFRCSQGVKGFIR